MVSATWKRIFCKIDMDYKNHVQLNTDTNINLKRDVDNFDRRYTQPINGIVIDAANIPSGAEILLHHNAQHDTYRIFDYKEIGADFISDTTKYFSIPESECYAWRINNGEWNPCYGFKFGLRIFKPYKSFLDGILPIQIKNKLYITSGKLKGKAVMTKGFCDYELIYQDSNGKQNSLIRLRHFENEEANIREEIISIDHETTEKINSGEYFIGITPQDAKPLNVLV